MTVISTQTWGGRRQASASSGTFELTEDVWVDGTVPGSRQRLYRRGTKISDAEAARLGLKKERAVQDKKVSKPATKRTTQRAKQE